MTINEVLFCLHLRVQYGGQWLCNSTAVWQLTQGVHNQDTIPSDTSLPLIPYFSLVAERRSIVGRQGSIQPAQEGKASWGAEMIEKPTQNVVDKAALAQVVRILAEETRNTEGPTQADPAVSTAVKESLLPAHGYCYLALTDYSKVDKDIDSPMQ